MRKINVSDYEELITKLNKNGYNKILDALYFKADDTTKVFTKKGRLNKSGACRALNCKPKELEQALAECKKLLEDWQQN